MKYTPTNLIHAYGLADAWGQAVNFVMKNGMEIKTEYGPLSKDICSVIEIREPFTEPMLHPQFPTKELHVKEYLKQWERDYDWKKQGFTYTYIDRFVRYPAGLDDYGYDVVIDQLQLMRDQLKAPGTSRRSQAITWIPEIDIGNSEPPCLQRLWVRKLSEKEVELHCMWRSRDLYAAWNSNYIALLNMIKNEILIPYDLRLIKLVDFCDSLHIYEADWNAASEVKSIQINPQLRRY